jgi:hypothetical protein
MGDMQLNKVFGRITMEQHGGPPRKPTDNLPNLDHVNNGTPNQKEERAAILLRMYAKPIVVDFLIRAIALCRSLLQAQKMRGHQVIARACEFMSNSHDPIWVRAMSSMTITVLELIGVDRENEPETAKRLPPGILSELRALRDDLLEWWQTRYACCKAAEVTHGGLSEHVISTGGRYRPGGDDQVRDVQHGLADGNQPGHVAGNKFWKNTLQFQDTFGAQLFLRMVKQWHYDERIRNAEKRLPPVVPGEYAVSYYADGHTTSMDGLPPKDPISVSVCYSTGEVWIGPHNNECGDFMKTAKIGIAAQADPAGPMLDMSAEDDN